MSITIQRVQLSNFHNDLFLTSDCKVINEKGQELELYEVENEKFLKIIKDNKVYNINISNAYKFHFSHKEKLNMKKVKNNDFLYSNTTRLLDTRTFKFSVINELQRLEPLILERGEVAREINILGVRYPNFYATNKGKIVSKHGEAYFKTYVRKTGRYYVARIKNEFGKWQTLRIHKIVAHTFRKKQYEQLRKQFPDEKIEIDHIYQEISALDTIHNNCANNLQFLTKRQHKEVTRLRNLAKKGIEVPQFFENVRVY